MCSEPNPRVLDIPLPDAAEDRFMLLEDFPVNDRMQSKIADPVKVNLQRLHQLIDLRLAGDFKKIPVEFVVLDHHLIQRIAAKRQVLQCKVLFQPEKVLFGPLHTDFPDHRVFQGRTHKTGFFDQCRIDQQHRRLFLWLDFHDLDLFQF